MFKCYEQAVQKARFVAGFSTKIEVECRSYEGACTAANAGAEVVMLDNFEHEVSEIMLASPTLSFFYHIYCVRTCFCLAINN